MSSRRKTQILLEKYLSVIEQNLGPQQRQSIDTALWWEKARHLLQKKKNKTKNQQQQHTNHTQERNMGSWCSKDLNSPMAFREDHKACDQLAHGSLISWYRGNTVMFQEPWSQVALACSSLKQDLGSQAEFEVRLWWEHWILATRPVVSDKGSWPFSLAEKNFHKDGESWSK